MSNKGRGSLLVVSSPSGAGKTTLCGRLRQEFPEIGFSVSFTTRPPRTGELDGREYRFVSRSEFESMIAVNRFAEYAQVHDNWYGTAVDPVTEALERGDDLLFDVDFQGGLALKSRFPGDVILVFILPPSLVELENRLRSRGTDSHEIITKRLKVACSELKHYAEYDYVIINEDLEQAYDALRAVYIARQHQVDRMSSPASSLLQEGTTG